MVSGSHLGERHFGNLRAGTSLLQLGHPLFLKIFCARVKARLIAAFGGVGIGLLEELSTTRGRCNHLATHRTNRAFELDAELPTSVEV